MAKSVVKSDEIVVGKIRLSFAKLENGTGEKTTDREGNEKMKYGAVLLVPKSDTALVAKIEKVLNETKVSFKSIFKKDPATTPWKDGDETPYEEHHGCFTLNVSAVKELGKQISLLRKNADGSYAELAKGEVYSGCYGYAAISFADYEFNSKRGISCYINKFLKTSDGEALGNTGMSNESAFGDIEVGEDEGGLMD